MKKKIKHVGNALRGVPVPEFNCNPRIPSVGSGLVRDHRNATEGVPYNSTNRPAYGY